jgi:hypothetical protein
VVGARLGKRPSRSTFGYTRLLNCSAVGSDTSSLVPLLASLDGFTLAAFGVEIFSLDLDFPLMRGA